jgi:cytochrome b
MMTRILVWDLPTRLFHWLLVVGFAAAAFLALVLGEDHALFPFHAILGLVIALIVLFRLIWGFVGSRYARFTSFAFGPGAVIGYLRDTLRGAGTPHVGHNPASAWAIFSMLFLVLALAGTGVLLGRDHEWAEELHELLAYAMLGVVAAHLIGVVLHTIRHRENITAAMIHGRKSVDAASSISSTYPRVALALILVTTMWAVALVRGFNPATRELRVPVVGAILQVGEGERESAGRGESRSSEHDDDD